MSYDMKIKSHNLTASVLIAPKLFECNLNLKMLQTILCNQFPIKLKRSRDHDRNSSPPHLKLIHKLKTASSFPTCWDTQDVVASPFLNHLIIQIAVRRPLKGVGQLKQSKTVANATKCQCVHAPLSKDNIDRSTQVHT